MKFSSLPAGSHIHMVAIGGTGMRALALILHQTGFRLTGSDINTNRPGVFELEKLGIKIFNGHHKNNLGNPALVIKSAIITDDNPEIIEAEKNNIPVILRTTAITELANTKTIHAVAGSHGKSTATAMLVHILKKEGIKFSWYFGSELRDGTPEAHWDNKSDLLVLETDESDHGFIKYNINNGVVLCIDPEHLEFYNFDLNVLIGEFNQFVSKSAENNGTQIINIDDKNTRKIIPSCSNILSFGLDKNADLRFVSPRFFTKNNLMKSESEIFFKGKSAGKLNLSVPGIHNIYDALSAIAGASLYGVSISKAISHLESFTGLIRRIEPVGVAGSHVVFDDDAGHPTELSAGIQTLKKYYPDKPLCIIHQPVRHSRVYYLAEEYAKVVKENLGKNDRYLASPATASDKNEWGVDAHGISSAIISANPACKVIQVNSFKEITKTVLDGLKPDEVIFLSGHPPGQIRGCAFEIIEKLKQSKF